MILTELRGYGIAENGISVISTNKPNTSLERAWSDDSNDTKHSILPKNELAYVPLEIRRRDVTKRKLKNIILHEICKTKGYSVYIHKKQKWA